MPFDFSADDDEPPPSLVPTRTRYSASASASASASTPTISESPESPDSSPLLTPSTSPSSPPAAAVGFASMFDKVKDRLADSSLKDSVVALSDRVGSELSQVSATLSEKSASTREALGKKSVSTREALGAAGSSVRDSISIDVESVSSSLPGRQPQRQKSRLEQVSDDYLPSLTWKQRVIGCLSCMVVGYTLSFGSFFRITQLLMGDPTPFVMTATFGNIVSLCGSCFLTGPMNQAKKMFHESRRIATSLYLGSLALTLLVAYAMEGITGQGILLIVLMLVQYVAIAWYCLSYIPFARQLAKRIFNRVYSEIDGDGV